MNGIYLKLKLKFKNGTSLAGCEVLLHHVTVILNAMCKPPASDSEIAQRVVRSLLNRTC